MQLFSAIRGNSTNVLIKIVQWLWLTEEALEIRDNFVLSCVVVFVSFFASFSTFRQPRFVRLTDCSRPLYFLVFSLTVERGKDSPENWTSAQNMRCEEQSYT